MILRRRSNCRSLSSEDHVASLRCISLIIKGLHLFGSANPPCKSLELPPFAMSLAFPTSDYYEGSASSPHIGATFPSHRGKLSPVHMLDSAYWLGCRSQSLPLLSASRCRRHALAAFSSWLPVGCLTSPADTRRQVHTCGLSASAYHLISRVGGGDISAHRHGLIGSCSSTFQYSAWRCILA